VHRFGISKSPAGAELSLTQTWSLPLPIAARRLALHPPSAEIKRR
jgi:hypothetical protein